MVDVAELRRWVDTLDPDAQVGIDDGGLILVVEDSEACLEIGGMPDWDEAGEYSDIAVAKKPAGLGELYLTRKDADVGVGVFDSIAWAFSEHVKQEDRPEFKAAVLYGNEDAPVQIDFYRDAEPVVGVEPAMTWRQEGERAADSRSMASCRRLLEDAQDRLHEFEEAISRLERQMEKTFGELVEIESDDIAEGQSLEDLIAQHELEVKGDA